MPMAQIEQVGEDILSYLAEKGTSAGMAQLGAAYMLGRLSCPSTDLPTDEQERKFVEDIMEWVGVYWGAGINIPPS